MGPGKRRYRAPLQYSGIARMSPVLRAVFWMSGAILSFSAMAVAGRYLASGLDTFEIMLYRSVIGVVIVLAIVAMKGRFEEISTRAFGLHLVRNIFHFTGQNLWFYAIATIPLAQVFALEFTAPIWAVFLAVPVLGERLSALRLVVAAIGFAGIMVITRPWLTAISPGLLSAALAAVGFAGSAVLTRRLTRHVSVLAILFWLTAMQTVFALIAAGYDGRITWPVAADVPWLVLVALGGLVAHYCLTTALSLAPASVIMPIDFLRLPLIALVGALLFKETVPPAVFVGAAMIFFANYLNIRQESRQMPRAG